MPEVLVAHPLTAEQRRRVISGLRAQALNLANAARGDVSTEHLRERLIEESEACGRLADFFRT
jgi:hypothetical protein